MNAATTDTSNKGVSLAFGALALAVAGPVLAALAAELVRRVGGLALIVTPPAALAMISVFAFHVRFAIGAIESDRKGAIVVAAIAIPIGVLGFFAGLAIALGLPGPNGGLVPLPG